MIVCTNCGNHNEDSDEFCGSCGKFLEWVGQRIDTTVAAPEPEPEPEPEPAKRGLIDRAKAAVGIDDHERAAPEEAEAEHEPASVGAPLAATSGSAAPPATPAALAPDPAPSISEPDISVTPEPVAPHEDVVDTAALEAEAAEAERRAQEAQEEARRRAEEEARAEADAAAARRAQEQALAMAEYEAAAARRAEQEAARRAEEEAKANAEAERRREAEAEAQRVAMEEAATLAAAEASAAAAADSARQSQAEASVPVADAAAQAEAEAEAARQAEESRQAAEALEAARRADEEARAKADAEAAARVAAEERAREGEAARRAAEEEARQKAEAEAKAMQEAAARAAEEEEARRRAEDEARAKAAAEARAKQEEESRQRAAALLARPKAVTPSPTAEQHPPAAAAAAGTGAAQKPSAQAPVHAAAQAPAAQTPVAQTPVAQQPTAAKAPPRPDPKISAPEKVVKAGDLICGQCGEGNDPVRKFCRKCGNSLAQAVSAKKLPWWKKLFGGKKARVSKEAGKGRADKARAAKRQASFKASMVMATLRKVALVLGVLGLGGMLMVPSVNGWVSRNSREWIAKAKDIVNPQFNPVNAIGVTASSSVPGHEPNLANDLGKNTYWAEGAPDEGVGQTLSFTFEEKIDLTKIIIIAGTSDDAANYVKQPRPKRLHLAFDNGGSADIDLKDVQFQKPQGFTLKGAKGITKVDIAITSVYKGQVGGGTDTAIAEVEFKKKG